MSSVSIILPCTATALFSIAATLWFLEPGQVEKPVVTIPPLIVEHDEGELRVWGGWVTEVGYQPPGRSAVEIRCFRTQQLCTESVASVHHHTEGAELDAESYLYAVTEWTDEHVQAVAAASMGGGCMDRRLSLYPERVAASLEWAPTDGCGGDTGLAMLIGDRLD